MKNLQIGIRILLIVGVAVIGMLAVGAGGLLSLRTAVMAERQENVRGLIDVGASLINHYAELAKRGATSLPQAQEEALNALKSARYSGSEYFFVLDTQGVMRMHPFAEDLIGKTVLQIEDPTGRRLFQEMVDLAQRQGSGFVTYLWPKPGHAAPQPKLSFVQAIPEWQWVVGSGVYIDDVDSAFRRNALVGGIAGLMITAVIAAFAVIIGRGISAPLHDITARMAELARGDLAVDVPFTDRRDEVGALARSLGVFKDTAIAEASKLGDVFKRWNRAVVQQGSTANLLQTACDILIKAGGFSLVWIDQVTAKDGQISVRQMALSSAGWSSLDLLAVDWGARGRSQSPTEATLATGQLFCCQDVGSDPRLEAWQYDLLLRQHASFASVPIHNGERLVGVLNLYARLPNAFSPLSLSMLEMMAGNLSRLLSGVSA